MKQRGRFPSDVVPRRKTKLVEVPASDSSDDEVLMSRRDLWKLKEFEKAKKTSAPRREFQEEEDEEESTLEYWKARKQEEMQRRRSAKAWKDSYRDTGYKNFRKSLTSYGDDDSSKTKSALYSKSGGSGGSGGALDRVAFKKTLENLTKQSQENQNGNTLVWDYVPNTRYPPEVDGDLVNDDLSYQSIVLLEETDGTLREYYGYTRDTPRNLRLKEFKQCAVLFAAKGFGRIVWCVTNIPSLKKNKSYPLAGLITVPYILNNFLIAVRRTSLPVGIKDHWIALARYLWDEALELGMRVDESKLLPPDNRSASVEPVEQVYRPRRFGSGRTSGLRGFKFLNITNTNDMMLENDEKEEKLGKDIEKEKDVKNDSEGVEEKEKKEKVVIPLDFIPQEKEKENNLKEVKEVKKLVQDDLPALEKKVDDFVLESGSPGLGKKDEGVNNKRKKNEQEGEKKYYMGMLHAMRRGDLDLITLEDCDSLGKFLQKQEEKEVGFSDQWLDLIEEVKQFLLGDIEDATGGKKGGKGTKKSYKHVDGIKRRKSGK